MRTLSLNQEDESRVIYLPTLTRLDIKEHINIHSAADALQRMFPDADTLSYPSAMHINLWIMGTEHESQRRVILVNSLDNEFALVNALQEDMQSYPYARPWKKLRDQYEATAESSLYDYARAGLCGRQTPREHEVYLAVYISPARSYR